MNQNNKFKKFISSYQNSYPKLQTLQSKKNFTLETHPFTPNNQATTNV